MVLGENKKLTPRVTSQKTTDDCESQVVDGAARDLPEHLQDGPPQRSPPGGRAGLTGAQEHRVVGNDAHGGRGGEEMVQIPEGDGAELLLQVGALRLRHAASYRQTLHGNRVKRSQYEETSRQRKDKKGIYIYIGLS